jgi:hypothetical protein
MPEANTLPDLSYYDPLRARQVSAEDPEQLSRELSDRFPPNTAIRFMARPFSCDPALLKRLRIHFEREKLLTRHEFSCFVDYQALNAESLYLFAQINFLEIMTELPLQALDKERWAALFFRCREYGIKLRLFLNAGPQQGSAQELSAIYLFLREYLGYFTLTYKKGYFAHKVIDEAFQKLAHHAEEIHKGHLVDEALNKNFYLGTYEYMRKTFGPRVKTVLEINPFADHTYYKELNRVPYTWDVSLSPIQKGQLDTTHLAELNKTFDAIVIFQGFPGLRNPQQVLQQLKALSRPTTQWVCVHYNLAAFPNLALLLGNQWQNSVYESNFWSCLKLHSKASVNRLFKQIDVDMQWMPTEVPRPDLKPMKQFLDQGFKDLFPEAWPDFLSQSQTMVWTGHGQGKIQGLADGFGTDEAIAEGFVSEGFV